MKTLITLLSLVLSVLTGLGGPGALAAQQELPFRIEKQTTPSEASLRGLSVVDEKTAWASGSGGAVLRTIDAGRTWTDVSIRSAQSFDFRDIAAFDARNAVVLGAGAPLVVYRTSDGGQAWQRVFEDDRSGIFFDGMAFFAGGKHGIAFSDPLKTATLKNGTPRWQIPILRSADRGQTWKFSEKSEWPESLPGEAGFAASGTCLAVSGKKNVWIGMGGRQATGRARVFRSEDAGASWSMATTPLAADTSAGIFSLVFMDSRRGVAVGGDYQRPQASKSCVALTEDGGRTWRAPRGSSVTGFRACVASACMASARVDSAHRRADKLLVAVGRNGSDYSLDAGENWHPIKTPRYHAIQFAPHSPIGWAIGPNGVIDCWSIK